MIRANRGMVMTVRRTSRTCLFPPISLEPLGTPHVSSLPIVQWFGYFRAVVH